jgi:fructose transport system permease protein
MSAATATQADAVDLLHRKQTPLRRVQSLLHGHPALSPALVLVISIIVFGFLNSRFIRLENLSLISQQVAVVGALAVGQTLIILTAGIDLSVGKVMLLAQMIMAQTAVAHGVPAWLTLILGIVFAGGASLANGFLVTSLNLPPFIVTLGSLFVFGAITLLYSNGQTISNVPGLLTWTGHTFSFGSLNITTGVILMLLIYLVTSYALRNTAWGRHVYATGDDAEAARLAGISTKRVLLSVYATAGVIYGLAAWIFLGRNGSADPNGLPSANLDSITAVVIGGTSLFGGRGVLVGSLIGSLIVGVFRNGLFLAGVNIYYQDLAVGVMIIAAVAIDQWIRKVRP